MKRVFKVFSFILIFLLVTTTFLSLILSREELLSYFGDRYIKSEGVEYSAIKGSLFSEIVLENVKYKDIFTAKSIDISYDLPLLFLKRPKISKVLIKDVFIDTQKIKPSKDSKAQFPPFEITHLKISRVKIKNQNVSLDARLQKLIYAKSPSIKSLKLLLSSPIYGKMQINGVYSKKRLLAEAKLYPSKKKLIFLKSYPYPIKVNIKADKEKIKLSLKAKTIKSDILNIKDINLGLKYIFAEKKADFNLTYNLQKDGFLLSLKQNGVITNRGDFGSKLKAKILKTEKKLPFKTLTCNIRGDRKKIALHVEAGLYGFEINGDYKEFDIRGGAKAVNLGFLYGVDVGMNATFKLSPLALKGSLRLKNQKNRYKTVYSIKKDSFHIDADITQDDRTFSLKADGSNITYSKSPAIKNLTILLTSKEFGKTLIKGVFDKGEFIANSRLYPSKKKLSFLKSYPYPIKANIKADKEKIKLSLKAKTIKSDILNIKDINLGLKYIFAEKKADFNLTYNLQKDGFLLSLKQNGVITNRGDFGSKLKAKILKTEKKLPFKTLTCNIKGDRKKIALHVEAGLYGFEINGDYKEFDIRGGAKGVNLGFLDNFPDIFKDDLLDLKTEAVFDVSTFKLKGDFTINAQVGKLIAKYKLNKKSQLFEMNFDINPKYKLWKNYRVDKISPANITIYSDKQSRVLNIDAKMLNVTLFRKRDLLGGWGNLATGYFDLNGKIEKKSGVILDINANLPSLKKFISDVGVGGFNKKFYIDAKATLKSKLTISKDILFKSKITMPWYKIVLDNKERYEGENLWIKSTIKNTQALISGYSFYVRKHHIYSNRASKVSFRKEGKIDFKEFWIYDNLLLKGTVDLLKKEGKLQLVGKNFNYIGKEGNITADANITATLLSNGKQSIEGKIVLLKGALHVEPKKSYALSDEDIVIIQDIHQNRESKRSINIQISSKKPIKYKIKDIELSFVPDFTIFQEEGGALEYLGMVTIKDGEVQKSGKVFKILKSEVYLRGANPINPYLNVNFLYHANDNIAIKVFIANTLSSPLMVLTSTPPMSQNDIMSYILFGKPASSAFEDSKNSQTSISLSTLLYGTGLKKMFQDTTHINIDTINILSSKDKRFGYEVGASINKKIRVIYKNDTISSIIIQYSLNKSIRIDVDVKESGEGVSILYAKDF